MTVTEMRDTRGVDVVVFHSMFGLRQLELDAAARIRDLGHRAVLPDLFDGQVVEADVEAGFALMDRVGWPVIMERARHSLADVADDAVLIGISMGVGVVGQLWPERVTAAAVACLCAPASVPSGVRPGVPVQLHVSASDERFAPAEQVEQFRHSGDAAGASTLVRTYPNAGHLFLDDTVTDYSYAATTAAWTDLERMLASVA